MIDLVAPWHDAHASFACGLGGVNAQCRATTTSLSLVALTGHVACGLVNLGRDTQSVCAEALSSILSASHDVSFCCAVSDALGVCDGVLANVCKLDAGHDTVVNDILVAASVRPSISDW